MGLSSELKQLLGHHRITYGRMGTEEVEKKEKESYLELN